MLLAALVINESITEAKELNLPLFIAFLDSHRSLIWPDHLTLDDRLKYQASMRLHIFPLIPL
jgi:hypothetical protein